jgi:hypothetical protein
MAACRRAAALVTLLLATRGTAAATDYGLRGLATTWETDDDNSILQLVGLPRSASGSAKVEIVGPLMWYDTPENSGLPLLPCAMGYDAGSAANASAASR